MIKIICVGKIKEKYYKEAILEYKKRIMKYSKIEIIELNDYSYDISKSLKVEQKEIMKVLNDSDYNIALDLDGIELDSISLSKEISKIYLNSSNITFIIGGSYGLSDEVKNKCQMRLSFSKLTFPHQLFRVVLLEQVYRVYKILNNEEYHK